MWTAAYGGISPSGGAYTSLFTNGWDKVDKK